MRPADVEIESMEGLARLAGEHGVGDPRAAHEMWHQALIAARRWSQAGQVAETLALNATTVREADEWFTSAAGHFARIGDGSAVARVELEWGKMLEARDSAESGRGHLEHAHELAVQLVVPHLVTEAETVLGTLEKSPTQEGVPSPGTGNDRDHDVAPATLRPDSADATQAAATAPPGRGGPTSPPKDGEGRRFFSATDWDLGDVESLECGWENVRPDGLNDESLSTRQRQVLRGLLVLAWSLRRVGLQTVLCRLATAIARHQGAQGTASAITMLQAEILQSRGQHAEAAAVAKEVLGKSPDVWVTLGDSPVTGFELQDRALAIIADTLQARGHCAAVVVIQRRRLEFASRLRKPGAEAEARARLALALSRAGNHEEAEISFRCYHQGRAGEPSVRLMWPANSLQQGDIAAAQAHLLEARSAMPTIDSWPEAWGLRGDVTQATGDLDSGRECWERGLRIASENGDRAGVQRLTERLSSI